MKKILISPSGVFSYFIKKKLEQIPTPILDQATEFGSNFMIYLSKKLADKPITDLRMPFSDFEKHEALFTNLINLLQNLGIKKITGVEKQVEGDIWHGDLDIECDDCFVELKTRSNFNLEPLTIFQCEVYKKITGKKYFIIYANRKNNLCMELKPTKKQIEEAQEIINCFEKIYNYSLKK